jgi:uncharacterized protein (DUF58 family)
MIAPTPKLIWIAAAIVLPATTVAGLAPGSASVCWGIIAAGTIVALVDAELGIRRARAIKVQAPEFLRITRNVPTSLPLSVEYGPVRLALPMPEGVTSEKTVIEATLLSPQPGAREKIDWPVTGHTRGDLPLPAIHLEKPSPLGLWHARGTRNIQCTLRVYPNLRDRGTAMLFLKIADPGLRMRRQVGKGREFDNLRHYLPGDSFEDIHWKATARRGFPVVKLYRVEQAQEVYAVIDHSRLSAREGILDSYVDAALHLALVAERSGDRFGLITFSDRTQRMVRAASGLDHFRRCRETIYNLCAQRVSPDFRDIFTSLQTTLRRRALLVFFTSLDDALLAETFEREVRLLARRHLVRVNVTRMAGVKPLFTQVQPGAQPEDLDAIYRDLAGQMLWNRMRTLGIALQNRGVRLTVVTPERIKEQVTAQYLEVKRRQAL